MLQLCGDEAAAAAATDVDVYLRTSWTQLVAQLISTVRSQLALRPDCNPTAMARQSLAQCHGNLSKAVDVFISN